MSSNNNNDIFVHNLNNERGKSKSLVLKSAMKKPNRPCKTERDCWTVFVSVCELSISDLEIIREMEYTTTSRIAMMGLHKDVDALLDAGISHAKAHMIMLFATYVLLCKQSGGKIPKNLTFDAVLELNFQVTNNMMEASSRVDCSHFTAASVDTSSRSSKGSSSHGTRSNESGTSPTKKGRHGTYGKKKGGKVKKKKRVSWSSESSSSCDSGWKYRRPANQRNKNNDCSISSLMDETRSLHSIPEGDTCHVHSNGECETCEDTVAETINSSSRWDPDAGSTVSDSLLMIKRNSDGYNRQMMTTLTTGATSNSGAMSVVSSSGDSCARKPSRRPSVDITNPSSSNWLQSEELLDLVDEGDDDDEEEETPTGSNGIIEVQGTPLNKAQPPRRRNSRGMDLDTDLSDYVAPREPWERSTLRWAVALDVDEDLTDSEWETDSSDDEDYDTDDEDEEESDDEQEEEEEEEEEQQQQQQRVLQQQPQVFRWQTQNVTMHELTLPQNKVLPFQFQALFREAAMNPEINIQEKINMALSRTPMAA